MKCEGRECLIRCVSSMGNGNSADTGGWKWLLSGDSHPGRRHNVHSSNRIWMHGGRSAGKGEVLGKGKSCSPKAMVHSLWWVEGPPSSSCRFMGPRFWAGGPKPGLELQVILLWGAVGLHLTLPWMMPGGLWGLSTNYRMDLISLLRKYKALP